MEGRRGFLAVFLGLMTIKGMALGVGEFDGAGV
jgi:hypothetical protein